MASPLKIDPEPTANRIAVEIRDRMLASGTQEVLFGLSGGVDSSLLAALCTRAADSERVHALNLCDRYSSPRLQACARAVARYLALDYQEQSITTAMRDRGVYATSGMRTTTLASWLNRLLANLYWRATGESPFLSTLKAQQTLPERWYQTILAQAERGMNVRHRYRREVLEALAQERGWLLLGAANRSEWLIGWFVKGGVDDLPIQPLLGLYKTQVRQLAAYLELPVCVLANNPSPDMLPGITDEFAIGLDYSRLDLILEHLNGELSSEVLAAYSIGPEQIEYVHELMQSSIWKRGSD